jgi:two-component system CheB/CheR fusion protein
MKKAQINHAKTATATKRNINTTKEVSHTEKKLHVKPFPVVGIGASAGGLEAFSLFLEHLPARLGMAYIFIQHLSPTHESSLPAILKRKTKMQVHEVTENMEIEKNNLYIIPPNKTLGLIDGHLKLTERPPGSQVFHSIDIFLTTLADVYKNNAIGIILSGTGTDGTEGLKAIKNEGGITFAQDETAKYDGMPRYAFDMGFVDFIMPPETIATELEKIVKHPFAGLAKPEEFIYNQADELRKIHVLLNNRKDIDFRSYKQTTISRRIIRRMVLNKMETLDKYTQLLRDDSKELDALFYDLLINVTSFFRDPLMKTALTTHVLPNIVENRKHNDTIRVWVPACATGEEAITIAIILLQFLGDKALSIPIQIFATDLNQKAIERARIGIYSKVAVQNLSEDMLDRFFIKVDGHYQVIKAIRDICIFAPHNLLTDPPFSRVDFISCQNVLIYLETQPQQKIIETFHYALKHTGYLLLGKSETIGSAIRFFEPVNRELRLYTKKQVNLIPAFDYIRRSYAVAQPEEEIKKINTRKESEVEIEADKVLLREYVPASVLINKDLEIIRFRGNIASFIEPATGKASLNLIKMVKDEIVFELRTLIQQAKKENLPVKKDNIAIIRNGRDILVSLEVIPIKGNENSLHFLVIFKDDVNVLETKPAKRNGAANLRQAVMLEKKVKTLQETIRNITEEFEATREELQSSNEEVLSSNEELQSINEELETSKEELQSGNEELITINEELYKKNAELKEMTDYADAIFGTMHESLLILTEDLRVKIANKGFYDTFNVTAEETENRYFGELGNNQWQIPELEKMLRMVNSGYAPIVDYMVTYNFPEAGSKTMLLNSQRISFKDGREPLILLAIQDITTRKQMEDQVKESEERLQLLIQNSFDVLIIFDEDANVIYESSTIEKMLGYKQEEKINTNLLRNPLIHPDDKIIVQQIFNECLSKPGQNIRAEFRLQNINGSYKTIDAVFLNLLNNKKVKGVIANYRDITERKQLEQQKDDFIGIASHELKTPVTTIKAYTELLHEKLKERKDTLSVFTASMSKQIEKLTSLIVDLLDFTRLENGSLKFRMEEFDIFELTKEIAESMQQTTKKHAIRVNAEGSCIVKADHDRTGEVLTNLISNAVKYSPDANEIIVTCTCTEEAATVSVQDFGMGIAGEKQGKIFNKFYREEESQNSTFPGLGLGLYISAEIIKRQNGKIWMESVKGKGSTFFFSLHVKKDNQ